MGKTLKGRECGKGICQRQDGRYTARFTGQDGKRRERIFTSLPEARNWLEDARYSDKHSGISIAPYITVDEWFKYWIEEINADLSPNTKRNYSDRYVHNIQPIIGKMQLVDVKPLHCKNILNQMEEGYAGSTIRQTYITMGSMFHSALMNDLIPKHPMDTVKYNKPIKAPNEIKFLTIEEQTKFMEAAKRSHNYYQYALILETGLRTGEMIGLTWDAIDWKKRTLTVNKTLEFRHKQEFWRSGPPKTQHSYRTIPLTDKAYELLREVERSRAYRKESDQLDQELEYIDRRTGKKSTMVLRDLVFLNYRTGMPSKNSSYDTHLYKLCDEAGIKRFCMHALRHTYATRAIERGVQPKVLQKLLGHGSIKTTMDKYVHVTDDSMLRAVQQFQSACCA